MNSPDNKNNEDKKTPLMDNNEKEKIYKILYSPYGYIKVLEQDLNNNQLSFYDFIQHKKGNVNNCLFGKIFKNNIKEYININIKFFSYNRKIISLEKIDVNSKMNILIEKLFINNDNNNNKENLKKYTKNSQIRLFSCKKGLRELNIHYTFFENEIEDNELLIFFNEEPLSFSNIVKGKYIQLSQMNKTALKVVTDEKQYIMGTYGYISGKHYFEVTLLTEPMIRSIVVGLSHINDTNINMVLIQKLYGYILSDMKKTNITFSKNEKEEMNDYGEVCTINDKIGVLFESRNDGVYISFYRNKKNLGLAFEKLPNNKFYYPAIELGLCGSKVQITIDIDFPDN